MNIKLWRKALLLSFAALLGFNLCLSAQAPSPPESVDQLLSRTELLVAEGKQAEAVQALKDRYRQVGIVPQESARIALFLAWVLETWKGGTGEVPRERLEEAVTFYRDVVNIGHPTQPYVAHNNVALLLVSLGRPAEGLAELRKVPADQLSRMDPSYRNNLDRVLEESGEFQEAFDNYHRTLLTTFASPLALEGIVRVAERISPQQSTKVNELVQAMIREGYFTSASQVLRRFLAVWAKAPEAKTLLSTLVRYYLAAGVNRTSFQDNGDPGSESELAFLTRLQAQSPGLAPAISDILRAYLCGVQDCDSKTSGLSGFGNPRGRRSDNVFTGWSSPAEAAVFSEFLYRLGDYEASRSFENALIRYDLAWSLSPGNKAAAFATAVFSAAVAPCGNPVLRKDLKSFAAADSPDIRSLFVGTGPETRFEPGMNRDDVINRLISEDSLPRCEDDSSKSVLSTLQEISFLKRLPPLSRFIGPAERRDSPPPVAIGPATPQPSIHFEKAKAFQTDRNYSPAYREYVSAQLGFREAGNARMVEEIQRNLDSISPIIQLRQAGK